MKRHEITEQEVDDWASKHWVQFAASFGEETKKRFEISMYGMYRVFDHGAPVYVGPNKLTAIEAYNKAQ
jgi:hypothetical protein